MDMRLNDRAEIVELLTRYCEKLDEYDFVGLAEVFTDDYVFDSGVGNGGPKQGKDVIIAAQMVRMGRWRRSHHQLGQTRLEFLGPNNAHGISYVIAWHQNWEGLSGIGRLRYVDDFVRQGDQWLISRREIVELGTEGFPESTWNPLDRRIPEGH